MMEPIVTEATHSMSTFAYVLMGLVLVFGVVTFLASVFNAEWKGIALKSFVAVLLGGLILAVGSNLISWLQGFNSF